MRLLLAAAVLAAFAFTGCDRGQPAAQVSPEAQAFLDRNKAEPGVKTTASGLQYKVVRAGAADGRKPQPGDEVKVHYEGTLLDGTAFDSSYQQGAPAVFEVGQLVEGWNEALQLMKPGDEWIVWIPPALGYGAEAKGPIPANSVLRFRLQLISVTPGVPTSPPGQ